MQRPVVQETPLQHCAEEVHTWP
jgi:hypothetical protein